MTRVCFGLTSTEGDRLGHLVRGVQMLRSYGSEAEVVRYSNVVNAATSADAPPALCCVLECDSSATEEGLRGIGKETEWALGKDPAVLTVTILRYGGRDSGQGAEALKALRDGRMGDGMTVFLAGGEFAKVCDWGQQLAHDDADVMGEWPSATGR